MRLTFLTLVHHSVTECWAGRAGSHTKSMFLYLGLTGLYHRGYMILLGTTVPEPKFPGPSAPGFFSTGCTLRMLVVQEVSVEELAVEEVL